MATVTLSRDFSSNTRLHWVKSSAEARKAVRSRDGRVIWIVSKGSLADCIAHEVASTRLSGKLGSVIFLKSVRPPLFPALGKRFKQVAVPTTVLPERELSIVLKSSNRRDRVIGGTVDEQSRTITLWRGDLKPLIVPLDAFLPTANGIRPHFNLFSVTDYGNTLRFGDYEAAADAVLYEFDPEFRRRLKQQRFTEENTIGASIRRLRKQRQLTRTDFQEINPKTLARIENGEIQNPHADTLATIAKTLGVSTEELTTF